MAKSATSITLEDDVKNKAVSILNELGLSLSAAIDVFLRQVIMENGLPFEVKIKKPNETTIAAFEEAEEMLDTTKYNRYSRFSDLLNEVKDDA